MNGIAAACAAVCVVAVAGSVISILLPNGNTKKLMSMVLGAFMLCSMIAPVRSAAEGFSLEDSRLPDEAEITASADEAYSQRIIAQAEKILADSLEGFLNSENIPAKKIRFYLKQDDNLGIIISRICIYIDKKDNIYVSEIEKITEENFGQTPFVIAES